MLVRWSWTNSHDNIQSSQSKTFSDKSLKPPCLASCAIFFFLPDTPVLFFIWQSPFCVCVCINYCPVALWASHLSFCCCFLFTVGFLLLFCVVPLWRDWGSGETNVLEILCVVTCIINHYSTVKTTDCVRMFQPLIFYSHLLGHQDSQYALCGETFIV